MSPRLRHASSWPRQEQPRTLPQSDLSVMDSGLSESEACLQSDATKVAAHKPLAQPQPKHMLYRALGHDRDRVLPPREDGALILGLRSSSTRNLFSTSNWQDAAAGAIMMVPNPNAAGRSALLKTGGNARWEVRGPPEAPGSGGKAR
jgi:hypothetical protein